MTAVSNPAKQQQDQSLVNSELTQKRSRGRPKGTVAKNHQFLLNRLQDMYGKDWNPILKAAEMATRMHLVAEQSDEMADMKASVDAWTKVAEFVTPRLKAVEIQDSSGKARQIRDVTINVVSTAGNNGIEQATQQLIKDIN